MHNFLVFLLALATFSALPAWAGKSQSHDIIRDTVSAFVHTQTQALPGKVTIQVADIDRRIVLPACSALEAFLPAGAQLNGNSNIGVRCNSKQGWSLFVQVNIKVSVNLLTLNKTLHQGQIVRAEDIGNLSSESLQAGTLTDPAQVIGKIMKYGVGSGQLFRQDMLRAPYSVKQGQTVHIRVLGSGFRVSAEGQSLNNAAEGETTTVRTTSGQTVSGVVRGGVVEISQ